MVFFDLYGTPIPFKSKGILFLAQDFGVERFKGWCLGDLCSRFEINPILYILGEVLIINQFKWKKQFYSLPRYLA